jgi:hypothetical protein
LLAGSDALVLYLRNHACLRAAAADEACDGFGFRIGGGGGGGGGGSGYTSSLSSSLSSAASAASLPAYGRNGERCGWHQTWCGVVTLVAEL